MAVDVHISIISDDNRRGLAACLDSLPAAAAGVRWQATVVDNASNDGTAAMVAAEFPHVSTLVNRHRRGFGANHNMVLRQVVADGSASHVLVLNDDTVLDAGCIASMVACADARPTVGAMAGAARDGAGRSQPVRFAYPDTASSVRFDRHGITAKADPVSGWLQGSCLLLRVAALVEVGVFDERFFLFYEDVDLSARLRADGWDLAVCPEATLVHVGHQTVMRGDLAWFAPRQGRHSRYLYLRKHCGPRVAALVTGVGRAALSVRALDDGLGALRARDRRRLREASALLRLAAYDPRHPPALPPARG